MIKDFLIISCTGKNNIIGLRLNSNFFIQKLQINIKEKDKLVGNIINFLKKNNANVDKNFSIIVNLGPGSFSSLRSSISIAKGLKISSGSSIYGFKDTNLNEFKLKNIEFLIKNNLLENKLIKPVYLS
tara:strand:+ start:168 stop:551 length:384 start_codon:yes stop_codon:yes gene_type:complete